MRALQLQAVDRLVEVEVPIPEPGPEELLVRTRATTICTSDLNDIARNPFGIHLPRVLGHEATGIVTGMGAKAGHFRVGDSVAAHPVIPCRACEACERGLGHLCMNLGHLGLDRDGTFAEYFCIRSDRVRCVPLTAEPVAAALLEPVAVCLEAVDRGRICADDSVLVVGDGPFGILIARLALNCNPRKIIVVGRHDFRLAQVAGAIALNEKRTPHLVNAIRQANDGTGVDVAVLCAGTQEALDLALASLRVRGRIVVFSAVEGLSKIDLFRLHTQELELIGACNDQDFIDASLERLADSGLGLGSLITHRLPFERWSEGFELARHGKDEALKVALLFGHDA